MATTLFVNGTVIEPAWLNDVNKTTYDLPSVFVKNSPYNAVGDGVTDDTAAINAAIAYVRSLPNGGRVLLGPHSYAVSEINATSATAVFDKALVLEGAGHYATKIVPVESNRVLLNLMGTNDAIIRGMTIGSDGFVSQCGIFMARSTTSTNCNNNKFEDVNTYGNFSKASVVCNGSESSKWFGSRFRNTNSSANNRVFWSGGNPGVATAQGITTINGGTVLDTNNPNTDNKMFGCEFYSPYDSAKVIRFSGSAAYAMCGCTIVTGSHNNVRMVEYTDIVGGRFNGPITWVASHFEGFGTGNIVHYLDAGNMSTVFDGVSSYGGHYVLSNSTAIIDYDRTQVAGRALLQSSTWTPFTTSPNSTNTKAYIWGAYSSDINFKCNNGDGTLIGLHENVNSEVKATTLISGLTRPINGLSTIVLPALPTSGTFTVGQTIQRETPVVGQPTGWKVTASGTMGSIGTVTAATTNGSNVVTLAGTGVGNAAEGQRIDISGAGGPFYIQKLVGTTAHLDSNATATLSAATVGFVGATLVALPNL